MAHYAYLPFRCVFDETSHRGTISYTLIARIGVPMSTPYHAKYLAHELTKRVSADNAEKLSQSLCNATVDLNPHQVEAALFAFRSASWFFTMKRTVSAEMPSRRAT